MILLFLFLCAWAGFAIIVGKAAASKGRDFAPWFMLALATSPLVAAIFLIAFGPKAVPTQSSPRPKSGTSEVEALKDLAELHRTGVLSDAEFDAEKSKVIKLVPLALFAAILIGLSSCGQPKWEYLIESIPDASFSKTMDTRGENRWEMISARRASDGSSYNPTFSYEVIFKRQK